MFACQTSGPNQDCRSFHCMTSSTVLVVLYSVKHYFLIDPSAPLCDVRAEPRGRIKTNRGLRGGQNWPLTHSRTHTHTHIIADVQTYISPGLRVIQAKDLALATYVCSYICVLATLVTVHCQAVTESIYANLTEWLSAHKVT